MMGQEETVTVVQKQPKRGEDATTLTTTISRKDKVRLKTYAAQCGKPVSDILHEWIVANLGQEE